MMSECDTQSDGSSKPDDVVHKFGNAAFSDVIFLVRGQQFHCHKMLLVAKCDYFAAMFTSGFKEKDQSLVEIDVGPTTFKYLMDIIYNGRIENDGDLFMCDSHKKLEISNAQFNKYLWKVLVSLFALADRFLITQIVRYAVESALLRYHQQCPHGTKGCFHCATKLLLALRFNMDFYKNINVSERKAIKQIFDRLDERDLGLSSQAMSFLLGRD